MKGFEERNLLSKKADTENGVPMPIEVSVKPESLAANPVVVFAKPANVAEQRRLEGYVGFANCPNQVWISPTFYDQLLRSKIPKVQKSHTTRDNKLNKMQQ